MYITHNIHEHLQKHYVSKRLRVDLSYMTFHCHARSFFVGIINRCSTLDLTIR